jgi:hypothetical protein
VNLKDKLVNALERHPELKSRLPDFESRPKSLREIAQEVESYIANSGQVINDDPLYDWLDEYRFSLVARAVNRTA